MRSLELFAGAGGLAIGVSDAGFIHDSLVEMDRHAVRTLEINRAGGFSPYGGVSILEDDVRNISLGPFRGIDFVSGGPPCQPFSNGGKKNGNGDSRNMFPATVDIIKEIAPKAFLLENVKGLAQKSFGNYLEYVRLRLSYPEVEGSHDGSWEEHLLLLRQFHTSTAGRGLTYNVSIVWLNTADYGLAQKRERVFIVGFRSDINAKWKLPNPTHSEEELVRAQWVTNEYWESNKVPKKERLTDPDHRTNQVLRNLGECTNLRPWNTIRTCLSDLPPPSRKGKSRKFSLHEYQPGARAYKGHTGSPYDQPSKTIKAGVNGIPGGENMIRFYDQELRYMTIREVARLQGFPDEYHFVGSRTAIMRQLGNAVPPDIARILAGSIKRSLEECEI
ncbi:MAG: DNA cytosine methyltransferase [Flavobacteriaceae bacterium]